MGGSNLPSKGWNRIRGSRGKRGRERRLEDVQTGTLSIEEAKTILQALKEIAGKVVKIEGELNYLEEAVKIAFTRNISIYDSLYIAMAKMKGLNLLTVDEAQANAAKAENITTITLE